MNADVIFSMEYQGGRNFMTPNVLERGIADTNEDTILAYEISSGRGISNQPIFGVTVVSYDKTTNKTARKTTLGKLCYSEAEAKRYVTGLIIE